MSLRILYGGANPTLGRQVARALGVEPSDCRAERFPDGELRPVVPPLRGDDVYLVQPSGPPASEHLVETLLLLDACRRAGADRVTAVVPYFGYARQDRRSRPGEPIGARVMAQALAGAGADRLVVVDPHTPALEAMCGIPVEMVTAVPALASALAPTVAEGAVLVAPDLGASKLAERFSSLLGRPVALVRKTRVTGAAVQAEAVVGAVAGQPVIVVDDMISTGATIEAAVGALLAQAAQADIMVAATHGVFSGTALDRLDRLSLSRLLVTDTLPPPGSATLEVVSVAPLLAETIRRLHTDRPLEDLLLPG